MAISKPIPSLTDVERARFWSLVDKRGDCWLWTGALSCGEYGRFKYQNHRPLAHRVSWVLANERQVPDGMLVCHACDITRCVRPEHLFLGTDKDNCDDKWRKGRARHPDGKRGEASHFAKVSASTVLEIRARASGGESQRAIAKSVGMSQTGVYMIVNRLTWAHL